MSTFLLHADDLLRGGRWAVQSGRHARALLHLFGFILIFGLLYGAVMGSFAGFRGERLLQVLYSALKVPLLLLATFALSIPSFFVLNSLAGLRSDFAQALRALIATQAGLTLILCSLAPFTAFFYVSSADYRSAILVNALIFTVASVSAQFLLRRYYRPLVERHPAHRWLVRIWLVVYAFTGIQMGWLLRPFIGDPRSPTGFFREDPWGNSYDIVARMIWEVISR